jgi:hypothetical protein
VGCKPVFQVSTLWSPVSPFFVSLFLCCSTRSRFFLFAPSAPFCGPSFRPPLFLLRLVHRRRFCPGLAVNNFLAAALESLILQGDLSCSWFVHRAFMVDNRCISIGGQK